MNFLWGLCFIVFLISCSGGEHSTFQFENIKQSIVLGEEQEMKKEIVKHKKKLNEQDSIGNTLLHYAVIEKEESIAKLLLLHGADPNILNDEEMSALSLARKHGLDQLVDEIHQFQINDWKQNGKILDQDHLEYAILNDNVKMVEAFFDAGIKVNQMELGNGFSPLIAASFSGCEKTAILLLEKGADPNDNFDTRPVLSMAAMFNQTKLLEKLLEKGAKVNATEGTKANALIFAVQEKNLEAVRLLIEAGADPTLKDMSGENALDKAIKQKQAEMVKLFRRIKED